MQILESSMLGLRAATIELAHPKRAETITLFPMVHVGEPAFYTQVYAEAFSQDFALVEGVRSAVVTRLTRSYRWLEGSKVSNLTVQPRYPDSGRAQIILADLSGEEFVAVWRDIPLRLRLLIALAVPVIGLKRRNQSRQEIAKGMSLEDEESQQELLDRIENDLFYRAVVEARDERLIERTNAMLQESVGAPRSIAIVYGAQHMRAMLRHLTSQGFRCHRSSWKTVFAF